MFHHFILNDNYIAQTHYNEIQTSVDNWVDLEYKPFAFKFVTEPSPRCKNCGAAKHVNLSAEGFCSKCQDLRHCSNCDSRRPSKFFRRDLQFCINCTQKLKNPNLRISVHNTFLEEEVAIDNDSTDIESLIRQHGNHISSNLERVLSDEGYASFTYKFKICIIHTLTYIHTHTLALYCACVLCKQVSMQLVSK